MKEDLWINKIKERMDNYSEPLPPMGWERLEKDLLASNPTAPPVRRIIPLRRWALSVAAGLVVAVSSVSLWLLQSPVADEVRHTSIPALAVAPDHLPQVTTPSIQTESVKPTRIAQGNASTSHAANDVWVAQEPASASNAKSDLNNEEPVPSAEMPTKIQPQSTEVSPTREKIKTVTHRPSSKDKLHLPIDNKRASRSGNWSTGISVGNTGGLTNLLGSEADMGPMYSSGSSSGKIDLSATADGVVSIPNGQELVFKEGLPYLQQRAKQIASIDHKQPLSFGLSVRKNLGRGLSVESGLTYTYLASDVMFEGSSEKTDQKLHYVGIPVRANWNFVDNKNIVMYVSGGGAVEKCVYGKIGGANETVKPLQLSIMGAVGAQYNISNRVGVYVEPGVSYFFNDGSKLETIRKKKPCNFTLQAGIRLTY